MSKQSTLDLQYTLNEWLRSECLPTLKEDGIYGPKTAAAYELMMLRSEVGGIGTPMPVPAPAQPWWTKRSIWGSLAGLLAGAAGLIGWSVDAEQLSALLIALSTVASAALALYGSIHTKGTVDQTLVARFRGDDVRLPARRVQPSPVPTGNQRSDDSSRDSFLG